MKPTQRERELIRGMEGKLHELALFAGAGGGILGTHLLGCRVVGAVELDCHARKSLIARQRDCGIGEFPIWRECGSFDGSAFRDVVDVVSAGFPRQPFSVAGKSKASEDDRNGWPHAIRIIREVRPAVALLENVPGLLSKSHGYFGTVLGDLAESGFDAVWDVLGADDVGARHRRKRLWLLAYSVRDGAAEVLECLSGEAQQEPRGAGRRMRYQFGESGCDGADANGELIRQQLRRTESGPCKTVVAITGQVQARRDAQPGLDGMVDVLAGRLDTPWGN